MPRCPFGPHRLVLEPDTTCRKCGQNLTAYAAARDLPARLCNMAREHLACGRPERSEPCLELALELSPDLQAAHWLLAATAERCGDLEKAREALRAARKSGAEVDLEWLPR